MPSEENEDVQKSEQEALEAKKEVFMAGGAVKIGQSMDEYRAEREEIWNRVYLKKERQKKENVEISEALAEEKSEATNSEPVLDAMEGEDSNLQVIEKQKLKDEARLKELRQELGLSEVLDVSTQKKEKLGNIEIYKKLPNVIMAEKKIRKILENYQGDHRDIKAVSTTIYEMLTTRSEFVRMNTNQAGEYNLDELMKNNKSQREWYQKTKGEIEKSLEMGGDFVCSESKWFGVNTRPEAERRDDIDMKIYTTIPIAEHSFIQHIPELAKELRQLSLEKDDIIKVKIPSNLNNFMQLNDSVVVHFKNKESEKDVLEILNEWMQKNNINEEPREMERTKIAADSKETSFSDLIAENIANWIEKNVGKYDNELLVGEAIKHAIEQSQKSPL
ncbi:MAG: hypothetical protein WC319_02285 [Candidatus Paceibacterota bacterium]|jgi:hypothetical protein